MSMPTPQAATLLPVRYHDEYADLSVEEVALHEQLSAERVASVEDRILMNQAAFIRPQHAGRAVPFGTTESGDRIE